MATAGNALLLKRQLMELRKNPVDGFSAGLKDESNLFEWEILIIGPMDTLYEGGFLKAELVFPPEYPLMPPTMKFKTPMWHPNSTSNDSRSLSGRYTVHFHLGALIPPALLGG